MTGYTDDVSSVEIYIYNIYFIHVYTVGHTEAIFIDLLLYVYQQCIKNNFWHILFQWIYLLVNRLIFG